ncbi:PilE-like protein [Elusimicrobium minutum Pei191]|uniref:PilE-like protein n=1 Tax=Elusimicrobium minutum (strain Pei191) TaxID=445932 RepID=B2KB86_ELUMP|nr:prepilin-type N-terminal cleavage/methylation domain-containing protein [Elusimicrobium minutum]ACC97908.1 PilE-like protein [Elusimicrobium minutum Pei191]
MKTPYLTFDVHLKNKGFTLIELLVVVLIIGILAAIALPQYNKAVMRSRAAEAITNIRILGEAQKRHMLATGSATRDFSELDISMKDSCTGNTCVVGKWAYHFDAINTVVAYYNSTGLNTSELTIAYRFAQDPMYNIKTGEFACLPRGIDKYVSLCKTMAGPNAKTDSSFAGGTGYIWTP